MYESMYERILSIILHVFAALGHPHDEQVARDFARAVSRAPAFDRELLAATIAVYAVQESDVQADPEPISWDAHAGRVCGYLQLDCAVVREHPSAYAQAVYWLWLVRRNGLGPVSPSADGARRRLEMAELLLAPLG